ncbi:MAG: hypothetical protein E7261_05050 [Lachnospiraceae bacterium]|nr:hypothetical protein [Lachnospiraceae bacterium]
MKKRKTRAEYKSECDCNSYKELCEAVAEAVKDLLSDNKSVVASQKKYYEQIDAKKKRFFEAVNTCNLKKAEGAGYVRDVIKLIITEKLGVGGRNVDIFLNDYLKSKRGSMCRFYMLLRQYDSLDTFMSEKGLIVEKDGLFVITEESLSEIFEQFYIAESFVGKTEILVQMLYQELFGLGPVDFLLEQDFDSIMGGASDGGIDERSLWVQYKGRNIYMQCVAFGDKDELERVCRCLSRFEHATGQLSVQKAYIVGTRPDGSRVVVTRPPFSESWSFFYRKFNHRYYEDIRELFCDEGIEEVDGLMKWLIKGCQVIGITGDQGCGKTTLLMYLIGYINKSYSIRVQEMNFELYLRKRYPERNIVSFRETGYISVQEGLDIQKKTDGMVNILGEVATAKAGSYMIQMGMSASLFTLFTHHATSTAYLLLTLRNYLMECGAFSNENLAMAQVLSVLKFDVHLMKDASGKRYIQRITEIIPKDTSNGKPGYDIVNLIEYKDGKYRFKSQMSDERRELIATYLTQAEKEEFYEFMERYPKLC